MPFDNTGTFNRIHSWEQDRIDGISIDSSRVDEDTDDIAEGLSQCMLRDGTMAMGNALNMNNFKIQNLAEGTAATDAVNKGQLDALNVSLNSAITSAIGTMLSSVWSVGSVYIGTQSTCPMATLISGSTWVLVSSGKALWTGDGTNANTTIAAGVPNISGTVTNAEYVSATSGTGCFTTSNGGGNGAGGSGDRHKNFTFTMNASGSSSVYGNSTTVQPPAYVVNVWRRTE